MRIRRWLSPQAGFSTNEWMIVAALIAVIAVAAGQISIYFAQQNKRLEAFEIRDKIITNLTYYITQTAALADSANKTTWNGNAINAQLNDCMTTASPAADTCDSKAPDPYPFVLFEPGKTADTDRPYSSDPNVPTTYVIWGSKGERCASDVVAAIVAADPVNQLNDFCQIGVALRFRPICGAKDPAAPNPIPDTCDKAKVLLIDYTIRTKVPGLNGVIETKTGTFQYVVP